MSRCCVSPMPPSHYEEAVARAVERIRAGELEKIVLAREVEVHAPLDHDLGAVIGLLREAFPSCYVFAVGRGDGAFIAASPELLVRRDGQRASTVALAGSSRRSGAALQAAPLEIDGQAAPLLYPHINCAGLQEAGASRRDLRPRSKEPLSRPRARESSRVCSKRLTKASTTIRLQANTYSSEIGKVY